MREIGKQEIEDVAVGAAVLGTGGGGDPYIGKLMALQAIEEFGPIKVITVDELNDDDVVAPTGGQGAPTVLIEKPPNGKELISAFKVMEEHLGKKIVATMPFEVGGINSMIPLALAARLNIPVVDADGIGRAFPELQMKTFSINGISATPMVVADEKGNTTLINAINNLWAERLSRTTTTKMGGSSMIIDYIMSGKEVRKYSIHNTLEFAEKIGKAIRLSKKENKNPIEEILDVTKGFELFKGKVLDINRKTEGSFVRGEVIIEGLHAYSGETLQVYFQNEHLLAKIDGRVLCITPDLISILDIETGQPITTEGLKYGSRCVVIGIPCDTQWRTDKGLATVGPSYFGYDIDYVPIEKLVQGRR